MLIQKRFNLALKRGKQKQRISVGESGDENQLRFNPCLQKCVVKDLTLLPRNETISETVKNEKGRIVR